MNSRILDLANDVLNHHVYHSKIKELQSKLLGRATKQKIKVYTPSYPNLENGVVQEIK